MNSWKFQSLTAIDCTEGACPGGAPVVTRDGPWMLVDVTLSSTHPDNAWCAVLPSSPIAGDLVEFSINAPSGYTGNFVVYVTTSDSSPLALRGIAGGGNDTHAQSYQFRYLPEGVWAAVV